MRNILVGLPYGLPIGLLLVYFRTGEPVYFAATVVTLCVALATERLLLAIRQSNEEIDQ